MAPDDAASLSNQQLALCAVAAAAALRSPNALWITVDEALAAGATLEAVEQAVMAAVRVAAEAVERDTAPTLMELRARWGAKQRWDIEQTKE